MGCNDTEPCFDDCQYKKNTPLPDPLRVPEGEDKTNKDKFFAENVDWSRVYGKKFNSAGPNNWDEIVKGYSDDSSVQARMKSDIDGLFANNIVDSLNCGSKDQTWEKKNRPKIQGQCKLATSYNEEVCVKDWTAKNLKTCDEGGVPNNDGDWGWTTGEKCACFGMAKTHNGADITSELLTGLYAMSNCSNGFKWGEMADNFCDKPENFKASIGNDMCKDRNPGARKEYCKLEDNIVTDTDNCSKNKLGDDDYNDVGISYCKRDGEDAKQGGMRQNWCKCYNLDTGVCETNLDAAGCRDARNNVESQKKFFNAEEYDILRQNMVCRPGTCSNGFLPKNYQDQCKATYRICGEDVDIGLLSNAQLLVKCHSGEDALPDFMRTGESTGSSRYERNKNRRREPPFDQGLLSKTPIKSWPSRWSTDNEDAKYIVGYTITSAASCLLVAGGLFMTMGKK
jgi:hypothetical protein